MRGRRRAAARRVMKIAAGKAAEWISLEKLEPSDLKALSKAIHEPLIDPVVGNHVAKRCEYRQ